jgi:hypothetical protein
MNTSTKSPKTIRVLIEIPEKWVDFESPLGFITGSIRQMVERQVKDAIIEQCLSQMEIPEITVTAAEVKDRMLTILAERALDEYGGKESE